MSITKLMSENQALRAQVAQLTQDNVNQRRILKRLVLDFSLMIRSPIPRLILWPSGLVPMDDFTLGIGKGRDTLTPEERFAHIKQPLEELEESTVVQLMPNEPAPSPPPPQEPRPRPKLVMLESVESE